MAQDLASVRNKKSFSTMLRSGDPVMVISGGNKRKGKSLKGVTGRLRKLIPEKHRVIVEGAKTIVRHKRPMSASESGGRIEKDGTIHISNVMYYVEELKRPVRLKVKTLEDGRKVRGYLHPESKVFEQIDT